MTEPAIGAESGEVPAGLAGLVRRCFPPAVHVTVGTARREARFELPSLAGDVFALLCEHPRTLAAVVMPDHVHWLLRDGWDLAELVDCFKSASRGCVLDAGDDRPLWQRSFFDAPVRSETAARMSARFLLANPVVAGLAPRWQDYPWACLDPSLGG